MRFGILILAAVLLALLTGFILHWLKHFLPAQARKKKAPPLLCVLALLLGIVSICIFTTPGLVLFHFWILSMVVDPVAWMVRPKMRKRTFHLLRIGIPALVTIALVCWGRFNIAHPVQTSYVYETQKAIRPQGYRIAVLTDIHYDTIQDPQVLQQTLQQINDAHPDLVILGGDIVEEGTSRERMEEVFQVLSGLESTYGSYYVYGNHDRQNYSRTPAYTVPELEAAITSAGITILQDTAVQVTEDLILAGREDAAWGGNRPRAASASILENADPGSLILMADHQPIGYAENAAAGVDIQISGHTHAGQIWPAGELLELFGTPSYGHYSKDNIDIYVSSGFAGWGYSLRTSERSEYILLDILPAQ